MYQEDRSYIAEFQSYPKFFNDVFPLCQAAAVQVFAEMFLPLTATPRSH